MIRRKAKLTGDGSPGFVLGWLIKAAPSGDESMLLVFEKAEDGRMQEVDPEHVMFDDGSPDIIPQIP